VNRLCDFRGSPLSSEDLGIDPRDPFVLKKGFGNEHAPVGTPIQFTGKPMATVAVFFKHVRPFGGFQSDAVCTGKPCRDKSDSFTHPHPLQPESNCRFRLLVPVFRTAVSNLTPGMQSSLFADNRKHSGRRIGMKIVSTEGKLAKYRQAESTERFSSFAIAGSNKSCAPVFFRSPARTVAVKRRWGAGWNFGSSYYNILYNVKKKYPYIEKNIPTSERVFEIFP
jgi:hypothetical protein